MLMTPKIMKTHVFQTKSHGNFKFFYTYPNWTVWKPWPSFHYLAWPSQAMVAVAAFAYVHWGDDNHDFMYIKSWFVHKIMIFVHKIMTSVHKIMILVHNIMIFVHKIMMFVRKIMILCIESLLLYINSWFVYIQ